MAREIIGDAKLLRIENDVSYATTREKHDSPTLTGFRYDHGNLLWLDSAGACDILFLSDGSRMKYAAARALWHMAPKIVQELIWGYRLAKKAGLLELPRCEKTLRELQKAVA